MEEEVPGPAAGGGQRLPQSGVKKVLPAEDQEDGKVAKEAGRLHAAPGTGKREDSRRQGNKNSCCQFTDSSFISLVVFNPRDNLT